MAQRDTARLQQAVDAAALAGARMPRSATEAERRTEAQAMFDANLGMKMDGLKVSQSFDGITYTYHLDYAYKTAFLQLVEVRTLPIAVTAKGEAAPADLDVVLVLDNSLSMAGFGRIAELRKAAVNFVSALEKIKGGFVQVAVVPFDDKVFAGPGLLTTQTSISEDTAFKTPANGQAGPVTDTSAGKAELAQVANGTWSGCVTDRPIPFDANGVAPTLSNAATLYPRKDCSSKLKPMRDLSPDLAGARAMIQSLAPNGLTNITIGLQWGLEAFTPTAPLSSANPEATQIMILMTDGANTDGRWPLLGSQMNLRTSAACTDIKSHKIILYTINMTDGDSALLGKCATSPAHFYNVRTSNELTPVFEAIAGSITPVRLSK